MNGENLKQLLDICHKECAGKRLSDYADGSQDAMDLLMLDAVWFWFRSNLETDPEIKKTFRNIFNTRMYLLNKQLAFRKENRFAVSGIQLHIEEADEAILS